MLVTFSCEFYENITMFGEIAKKLLTLMGHSATIPGALNPEEVPEALSRLKNGVEKTQSDTGTPKNPYDEEMPVSLKHRALPLINMLEAAAKNKTNVLWE
ncbi:MAG: DUF1840 domain-containing protein [Tatlockia sp.]|nr:DUF1840 domain-containing protein [Tatlockia sp.]